MATEVGNLQSRLTLDFTDFAEGMSAAIRLVRKFGSQLQNALGKTSAQGFLTIKKNADDLRQSLVELQAAASSFQSIMKNTNTGLSQFTGVQAFTSRMQQSMSQVSNSVGQVGNQVIGLGQLATNSATNFGKISTNVSQATSAASNLAQQVGSTATAATKATTAMNKTAGSATKASNSANKLSSSTGAAAKNANNLNNNLKQVQNNLKKSSVNAMELRHIISGIVISQTFYELLNIVEELVSGSIQFMHNMAQAQVAFSYLIGSGKEAATFIRELQDFAVVSPLSTEAAMASARKLMAMGFQAESVRSVLEVLTDTSAVFTNSAADMTNMIDHITLAIGQMKASGTVMMQELRQLYNAGVPVFDILQEELGLTAEQVQNIGDQSIDSTTAVTALLVGLQKRFGGAAKEFTQTIPGAMSAMKDSIFITAQELFKVPYEAVTQRINGISKSVNNLALITRAYGAGGFFQAIFPKSLQMQLRNIIGSFSQFGKQLSTIGAMVKEVFQAMGTILVNVLSIILPPLTTFGNIITQITKVLFDAIPAVKYLAGALLLFVIVKTIGGLFMGLWARIAAGKICTTIAKSVMTLVTALKNLALWSIASKKNFFIFLLTTGLLVLLATSERVRKSLTNLFNSFQKLDKTISPQLEIGFDPNDIAQPDFQEAEEGADKYKGSLADVTKGMEDVGKATEETQKKLKNAFNQSFDEVYGINPTTADDLGLSAIAEVDLSDILGQLEDLNSTIETTEFSGDFWKDWEELQGLELPEIDLDFGSFWEKLAEDVGTGELVTGAIVVALGAAIGAVAGSAKIGAAVAGLALWLTDLYWPEISKAFKLDDKSEAYTIIIATELAYLIGNVAKLGKSKSLILAAIAGVTSWLNTQMGDALEEMDPDWDKDDSVALQWGGSIATIIGGITKGIPGALIATAVYDVVYWITNKLRETLVDGKYVSADMFDFTAIAAAIGAGIGLLAGGPPGAAIGAGIGFLVGNIAGAISDAIKEIDGDWDLVPEALKLWGQDIGKAFTDAWKDVGSWISPIWDEFIAAWGRVFDGENLAELGTDIMDGIYWGMELAVSSILGVVGGIFKSLWDAFCAIFGIASPAKEMYSIGENILKGVWEGMFGWVGDLVANIAGLAGQVIEAFTSWIGNTAQQIADWATNSYNTISGWVSDATDAITGWVSDTSKAIGDWASGTWDSVTTWAGDTARSIGGWVSDTASDVGNWAKDTASDVGNWAKDTASDIGSWASDTAGDIGGWIGSTAGSLFSWGKDTKDKVKETMDDTKEKISTWSEGTKTVMSGWVTNLKDKVKGWASSAKESIGGFVSNTKEKISGWVQNTKDAVGGWVTQVKNDVSGVASSVKTSVSSWVSETKTNISTWTTDTWSKLSGWCDDIKSKIGTWASDVYDKVKSGIGGAIDKVKEFFGLSSTSGSINVSATPPTGGHANGGVFDREHWARFNENNKREAIIPLETESGMKPFSDAVSNAVISAVGPMLATMRGGNNGDLRPLYVGTLIADEKGLKELQRKMEIIELNEKDRRGQ